MKHLTKTIFEKSQKGQKAYSLPRDDGQFQCIRPSSEHLRGSPLDLPEVSELDLTRHFSNLAHKNAGIDTVFYPLGSCTMKLNPRINEICAALPHFTQTHPLAPDSTVQGNLFIIHSLIEILCQVTGMTAGSLAPNAGAQGEFTGIKMIRAFHNKHGDSSRDEILIPDNAHGTNAATAALAGYKTITIPSNKQGDLDMEGLRRALSNKTAGLMLTNPNTLGIFSTNILEVSQYVHDSGGLLYYDGANLNAILNVARPGDMGFDVIHLNLHKTFSTPHGGGGPGSGPVLCSDKLKAFLPLPHIEKDKGKFKVNWKSSTSIGLISTFHGNFLIYLRAYLYIILHGLYGLRRVAEAAVLNANYLKKKLEKLFTIPYPQLCKHEFVVQADNFLDKGIRAYDIAKRLLDYGFHAPTIYFPLIVKECLLIEPTETESKETLDAFVIALEEITKEIKKDPSLLKDAPYHLPVARLNETEAAKHPILGAGHK